MYVEELYLKPKRVRVRYVEKLRVKELRGT